MARSEYEALAREVARKYGLNPDIFTRLIDVETGGSWSPTAQSPVGAMGLTQLMPGTASDLGVVDISSPASQLDAGARYLKQMLNQFGRYDLALAAYNAGPGAVQAAGNKIPNIGETTSYVQKVLGSTPASGRLPVRGGTLTALFGPTSEQLDAGGYNKGIDIGVPVGTPVENMVEGTVIQAGSGSDGWGVSVKVKDAHGYIHNYGHMSATDVKVGMHVQPGDLLGKSGNTGASTGPHLSYDVLDSDGTPVDPSPFVGFNAVGDNRSDKRIGRPLGEVAATGGTMPFDFQGYASKKARYNQLAGKYGMWLDPQTVDLARSLKLPQPAPAELAAAYQEMTALEGEIKTMADDMKYYSPDEIRKAFDAQWKSSPDYIDAENSAAKYAREVGTRSTAVTAAAQAQSDQLAQTREAESSFKTWSDSGEGNTVKAPGFTARPALKSGDQLFNEALARITKNLPEVKDIPYPGAMPSYDGPGASHNAPLSPPKGLVPGGDGMVPQEATDWAAQHPPIPGGALPPALGAPPAPTQPFTIGALAPWQGQRVVPPASPTPTGEAWPGHPTEPPAATATQSLAPFSVQDLFKKWRSRPAENSPTLNYANKLRGSIYQ